VTYQLWPDNAMVTDIKQKTNRNLSFVKIPTMVAPELTPAEKLEFALARRWVGKSNSALACLSPSLLRCLSRLQLLTRGIEVQFKIDLPRPSFSSTKEVKDFCDGILDPCVRHEWRHAFFRAHLPREERLSIAATLFLFRKVCPSPLSKKEVRKMVVGYIEKMTTPQDPPPADFVAFAREELLRQFPPGWDKHWESVVGTFLPPTSACLEKPRSGGGVRGCHGERSLRGLYSRFVGGLPVRLGSDTRVCAVPSGGKTRLVSVFSCRRSFLTPLHRLIYGFLSKKDWLLRGEANLGSLKEFRKTEGEIFVSGDYESATDNLNIHLSRMILQALWTRSRSVPNSVWEEAYRALTATFESGRVQERGQLMGTLLSFPLLCIANYLAFRFSIRRETPVKINGDDIVFRCRPGEYELWRDQVSSAGLTLSRGKTVVSSWFFSINSTFFSGGPNGPQAVPFLRPQVLFGAPECPSEIAGRLGSVRKWTRPGGLRDWATTQVLRECGNSLRRCQRSVRRGLAARVNWLSLRWAGLAEWERFYCSLPQEPVIPVTWREFSQDVIPPGWVRMRGAVTPDSFYSEMVEHAWSVAPTLRSLEKKNAYWERVRDGTFRFHRADFGKLARLAKVSLREATEMLTAYVKMDAPVGMGWTKERERDAPVVFASPRLLEPAG